MGYNPRSRNESDTTERLHFHFLFTFQYSCLENSMDRGTWWATVYRVAKSQTGLKRLSTHAQFGLGSSLLPLCVLGSLVS